MTIETNGIMNELNRMSDIDDNNESNLNKAQQGKVILTGLVQKRCGWVFYKPRQLVLTDILRLYYFDPQTNELKVDKDIFLCLFFLNFFFAER